MRTPRGALPGHSPAQLFVLLALAKEPSHGADIIMQVLADSGARLLIGRSTIYDILKELEAKGLARSWESGYRTAARVYQITPEGREALRKALPMYESAVSLAKRRLR